MSLGTYQKTVMSAFSGDSGTSIMNFGTFPTTSKSVYCGTAKNVVSTSTLSYTVNVGFIMSYEDTLSCMSFTDSVSSSKSLTVPTPLNG